MNAAASRRSTRRDLGAGFHLVIGERPDGEALDKQDKPRRVWPTAQVCDDGLRHLERRAASLAAPVVGQRVRSGQ
ncbi:hypothetical protein FAIPA1_100042 [Frankia sp. AiPs1]